MFHIIALAHYKGKPKLSICQKLSKIAKFGEKKKSSYFPLCAKNPHLHFNLIIWEEKNALTESRITQINIAFDRDTLISALVRLAEGAVNISRWVSKNSPGFCVEHNLLGLQVKSTLVLLGRKENFQARPPCLKARLCCC